MLRLLALCFLALAVGATPSTAGAAWVIHAKAKAPQTPEVADTKIQAERNILGSVAVLRRLDATAVNVKTNTLRSNTRVDCVGNPPKLSGGFGSFTCTLSYRTHRLRLRYVAKSGSAFGLHVLSDGTPTR